MQKLLAEGLGTAFLLIGVVGSGIMGAALADGNTAIALLANAIATGCILYALITTLGPVSGAHFNPAVTLAFFIRGEIAAKDALFYTIV
jgi:glycerol uptake facilitator-like aquaporin